MGQAGLVNQAYQLLTQEFVMTAMFGSVAQAGEVIATAGWAV